MHTGGGSTWVWATFLEIVAKTGRSHERAVLDPPCSFQANATTGVYLKPAVKVNGLLRTPTAYGDRSVVLIAFQLHDAMHNTQVETAGLNVSATITHDATQDRVFIMCNVSGLSFKRSHYLGQCHLESLPSPWFQVSSTSTASVVISVAYRGQDACYEKLERKLTLMGVPSWFQSRTLQGGSDWLPTGYSSLPAQAFATLPISPLRHNEVFPVQIYAKTGGQALSGFDVDLNFNPKKLGYISSTSSSSFQSLVLEHGPSSVRAKASGLMSGITPAEVTGSSVHLFTVWMQFLPDTDGEHRFLLQILTRSLANLGGALVTEYATGFVTDYGAEKQAIQRRSVAEVGIFVYSPTGYVANTAVFMGGQKRYPLTVIVLRDLDTNIDDHIIGTSSADCQAATTSFSLEQCDIVVTDQHHAPEALDDDGVSGNASVSVTYGSFHSVVSLKVTRSSRPSAICLQHLVALLPLETEQHSESFCVYWGPTDTYEAPGGGSCHLCSQVYYPRHISISVGDRVLNRIAGAPPPPPSAPPESRTGRRLSETSSSSTTTTTSTTDTGIVNTTNTTRCKDIFYQWTSVILDVDGLLATQLVTFDTDDPSVAEVTRKNKLNGLGAGNATLFLSGPGVSPANLSFEVSDEPVHAVEMISRLTTDVWWEVAPPKMLQAWDSFVASAMLVQKLHKEGSSGRIESVVLWSDGTEQSVPHQFERGYDEMYHETTNQMNLLITSPRQDYSTWIGSVPFAALREVGELFSSEWRVCGVTIASSRSWVAIDLPMPLYMNVTWTSDRLTPYGNDASMTPISVPTVAGLIVLVTFDNGDVRDFSLDPRVNHTIQELHCATLEDGNVTMASVPGDECANISVVTRIPIFEQTYGIMESTINSVDVTVDRRAEWTRQTSRPVVYLQHFTVTVRWHT